MTISTLAVIMTILAWTCTARDVLLLGEELKEGESLDAGDYKLLMQDHCNLALYDKQASVWISNTALPGKRGCKASLTMYGSLEVKDMDGLVRFNSKSHYCCGNFVLVLQRDRNLVLYGYSIWATGTDKKKVDGVAVSAMNGAILVSTGVARDVIAVSSMNGAILASTGVARDVMLGGDELKIGESLEVGDYKLLMQDRCNLVLYDKQVPVWISNAGDPGIIGCHAQLTYEGFLAIYDKNGKRVYASNSPQKRGNYVLVLQGDRNLVIYGPPAWATGTDIRKVGGVGGVAGMNGTVDDGGSSAARSGLHNTTALGDVHELEFAAAAAS